MNLKVLKSSNDMAMFPLMYIQAKRIENLNLHFLRSV